MKGSPSGSAWLFSPGVDLAVFGGPCIVALGLLAATGRGGALDAPLPAGTWLLCVVGVDVAHVWSTGWRVYLDPAERSRRSALYLGTPLAAWVGGVLLHSASAALFWRVLAYVAVLHFVRQQYGWVALSRRRRGPSSAPDRLLDDAAIYAATLYPLLYWHAHLPREIAWFVDGDFLPGVPRAAADLAWPLHLAITAAYVLRQATLVLRGQPISHAKNLVVASTWISWYAGIVAFDSDYAFTVTNVLGHGIPYLALVWIQGHRRPPVALAGAFTLRALPLFLAPVLATAFAEEWIWDRLVWHDHPGLFPGAAWTLPPALLAVVAPLLAVPQATHYVLDAFIWKGRDNPEVARALGLPE